MSYYSIEEQHAMDLDKQVEELKAELAESNNKRFDAESKAYQYKTAFEILVNALVKKV